MDKLAAFLAVKYHCHVHINHFIPVFRVHFIRSGIGSNAVIVDQKSKFANYNSFLSPR